MSRCCRQIRLPWPLPDMSTTNPFNAVWLQLVLDKSTASKQRSAAFCRVTDDVWWRNYLLFIWCINIELWKLKPKIVLSAENIIDAYQNEHVLWNPELNGSEEAKEQGWGCETVVCAVLMSYGKTASRYLRVSAVTPLFGR